MKDFLLRSLLLVGMLPVYAVLWAGFSLFFLAYAVVTLLQYTWRGK